MQHYSTQISNLGILAYLAVCVYVCVCGMCVQAGSPSTYAGAMLPTLLWRASPPQIASQLITLKHR